ncbi:cupredoxin domain-containing protein [Paenibacillus gansuensis]|uniref:Cupredoxin domain-containing protein n=1 Tax=Paenibacillus gansuensis TaxID=306542 RepID=A0ABW5PMC8_9BACL
MSNFFVVTKRQLQLVLIAGLMVVAATLYLNLHNTTSALQPAASETGAAERTIHIVTGEYKSTGADGKEIEAYTFHPGTIYVGQGEPVNLSFYGVNGGSHPFIIEGTNIRSEVRKGKETVVRFQTEQEGTYRIVCLTHPENGRTAPMIGYIIVD